MIPDSSGNLRGYVQGLKQQRGVPRKSKSSLGSLGNMKDGYSEQLRHLVRRVSSGGEKGEGEDEHEHDEDWVLGEQEKNETER